jgi:hypothetical protein
MSKGVPLANRITRIFTNTLTSIVEEPLWALKEQPQKDKKKKRKGRKEKKEMEKGTIPKHF